MAGSRDLGWFVQKGSWRRTAPTLILAYAYYLLSPVALVNFGLWPPNDLRLCTARLRLGPALGCLNMGHDCML